ncbi:hypothetical protein C8A03DRAFT_15189 [Achaetomium macrosporum]|uniref:LYR motif-containing protein Cup1-like N-terminal domain-containing protein n=1 Tax=Achaetomium macrosporum TaxID=79813 RepID=A0AAN7CB78_9PEZI|nr:hypothetical protein C8A03DRAFT_15189 [Achaetomium macrosporum]
MSRPLRIPHPGTPLHLYRHLLREASYLPPLARPFADGQIKDRFRQHQKDDPEGEKTRGRIRQAHHELRVLRAANAGDMTRMRRVLLRAFGRVGRRRRELMAGLLHRDMPTNTEELQKYAAEALDIAAAGREIDWLDAWDLKKLRTFANSQIQAGLVNNPKSDITPAQINPGKSIPTENAWGRPLTPKLARTKLKKLWKTAADKCMPPLPREEWERLGNLVTGAVHDPRLLPPARRPVARSMSGDGPGGRNWDWQSYAIKPVAVVDRPANRQNKLLTGAVDDNTPTGDPQPIECHNYTARTWQRLLASIWRLTATMEKRPDGQSWKIEWGKLEFWPAAASAGDMEFFRDFPEPEKQRKKGKGGT